MRLAIPVLACLLALAAPLGSGSSPRDPFEATLALEGDPVVGEAVTLRARVEDHATNMPHGDTLRLELPEWVAVAESVEWSPEFREGGVYERAWTLTPTRVGFWAARLAFTDAGESGIRVIGPTLRAWSDEGAGAWSAAWSTEAYAQVAPEGAVEVDATTSIEGDEFVLAMTARGTRDWMRHAEVFVQGNAMGVGDTGIGRDGATARMELRFEVPVGTAAQLAPNAGVRVRFDGGTFEAQEEQGLLACLSFTAARDASGPRWEEQGECEFPSRFGVPLPGALAFAALVGGALVASRSERGSP